MSIPVNMDESAAAFVAGRFSLARWLAILIKEFIQLKRDRLTFGMVIGIPIVQLILFGFAINSDPRHLPTAVRDGDPGPFSRALIAAAEHTGYFRPLGAVESEEQADAWLREGRAQFVLTIPAGFSRALMRGERPQLLLEADATDPGAVAGAVSALLAEGELVLARELPPQLRPAGESLVDWRVHRRFNPEGVTSHNIVPGLMGVILTMTMILMTGLAMTRERERGTFENLLATPALPIEVITGKIAPYILIGLIQVTLVLIAARFIFDVPMHGSLLALYGVVFLFICANLTLGITFSSIARNQLQAMQMTFFFFLPSILLSGFMFPFRGMPDWAQSVGNLLPLTHFLRLVRGILLKGADAATLWPHIWPILAFTTVVLMIGLKKFRRTLD